MLWKFTNTNKYGHLRSRIVYADGALRIGRGFGPITGAQRFRYESRTPYFGFVELNGKRYLTPDWIEVHPQTTFTDVHHIVPEVEQLKEKNEWEFKSSSSDSTYKVRQNGLKLTCSCPGAWRAKDRKCKHIKAVENGQV
jgi:hypothetical protein